MALSDESSRVVAVAGFPWESEHRSHADALKYAERCRKRGQRAQLFAEYEGGEVKQRHVFKTDAAAAAFARTKTRAWKWGVVIEGMA